MLRRTRLRKNAFKFTIFLLISSLSAYLIYTYIFSKKVVIDNVNSTNPSTSNIDSETTDAYEPNDSDKLEIKNKRSFDKSTLINDNRGVPVLYYHSVKDSVDNEVTISPENLKMQLKYIKDSGYVTLTLNELKEYLLNDSPIPSKSIVITFDDGYMDNFTNAFPILKDLNMVATIFCITTSLDGNYYLSKQAISEMYDYGIDIQSHTVNHPHLDKMSYREQLFELSESKKYLESLLGTKVDSIAYPFGDFNNDSIKAAIDSGYSLGFTTRRGLSDRDDNPLKLDRIYISSDYDMDTFKKLLTETKK